MSRRLVLDASAVLAVLYQETGAQVVSECLTDGSHLSISAVNLCETATKLAQSGWSEIEVREGMDAFLPYSVQFDLPAAMQAAKLHRATHALGLSLGDRACLALGISRDAVVLTADRAWEKAKLAVEVQLIR